MPTITVHPQPADAEPNLQQGIASVAQYLGELKALRTSLEGELATLGPRIAHFEEVLRCLQTLAGQRKDHHWINQTQSGVE